MSKTSAANRIDVVFIRKSSPGQDESGQKLNVQNMLKARGVYVPDHFWFVGTVSRRKVKANTDFLRLMELVEGDKVNNVYIESQDRWGTKDRPELFTLLGILRDQNTRLYDLRAGKDLTERDLATEMLAFVNSIKSEKELQDISYRSLRSRVNNFKDTGSWPTGTHPYGYGKACYSPDGKLLWVWQPINRSEGQLFYPDETGDLNPVGPTNAHIPRKNKRDVIKLVPSNNPDYVRAVKLVFDLFVRVGLSRRQISFRLNAEGLTINGGPFTHPDVRNILINPVYRGDTVFGKVQTGELHTFDAKGLITEVKRKREKPHRDLSECLVKQDTHEALVDRKTWQLAQEKLASEQERASFSPRNPAYFLKQLFVCGHCGKGLTGRTETNPDNGRKTVVYVCSSYSSARCNGHSSPCGYQRITHDDAEKLLLDKIAELNLPFEQSASEQARANLQERLARLGHEEEQFLQQWESSINEGVDAFASYLVEVHGVEYPLILKLRKWSFKFYCGQDGWGELSMVRVSEGLGDLRAAITAAEAATVEEARKKVAELEEEHAAYTRAWVKATSELQQGVLKQEMERLEREISDWKPRTVPLSERFKVLFAAEAEREAERKKLLAEWPTLENREKGEALRRLFKTVTLFWERTFRSACAKPTRPRKTKRPGRFSYVLQRDRIRWAFATLDFDSSSWGIAPSGGHRRRPRWNHCLVRTDPVDAARTARTGRSREHETSSVKPLSSFQILNKDAARGFGSFPSSAVGCLVLQPADVSVQLAPTCPAAALSQSWQRSWPRSATNSGPWTGNGRLRTGGWARPGSGGNKVGKNPTDRGKKGTKESVLVDAEGGPLGAVLAAANVNDHLLLRETIEAIVIERPEPTPEAPQHLSLDADYDNPTGREAAAAGKYTPHIVPKEKAKRSKARAKGHKPRRWVVERTLAWLCKCRAILVRYDKKDENFLGLIQLACALCWYRRLHRLGRCDSKQGPQRG